VQHITRTLSTLFGKLADTAFPTPIQNLINKSYVSLLGLNMEEFQAPEHYTTLNALFTRALQSPRSFDNSKTSLISPCDAYITDMGTLNRSISHQIKGMLYDTHALLEGIKAPHREALEDGDYLNFYLSPKDYHRFHIPCDSTITRIVHIPRKLYPVNERYLKKQANLFVENERVIVEHSLNGAYFYLIYVGALNVGRILINALPELQTNKHLHQFTKDFSDFTVEKGEEFGRFEMGSTVVALFPKGLITPSINAHQTVRFGETIAHINEPSS